MTTPRIVNCPTCNKAVKWTSKNPNRPFCSERCKLIDLGSWAAEEHRIPESNPPDFTSDEPERDL
ncbi:DNA gyrase inhibitor YacG [Pseudomonadales bacterium]|nr:DNA gyrase inhibitor YacG [Pseudomonadales bacterium]MDG1703547.1 DNA gyrase inhibitor YacG [Pseudomonadales bacterium]